MLARLFILTFGMATWPLTAIAATDMIKVQEKYEEIEKITSSINFENATLLDFIQTFGRSPDLTFEDEKKRQTRYSWFFHFDNDTNLKDTLQFIIEVNHRGKVLSKETTLLCKH